MASAGDQMQGEEHPLEQDQLTESSYEASSEYNLADDAFWSSSDELSSLPFSEDELERSFDSWAANEWSDVEMSADEESSSEEVSTDVGNLILQLPPEVFQKIMGYLSFHEVNLFGHTYVRPRGPASVQK